MTYQPRGNAVGAPLDERYRKPLRKLVDQHGLHGAAAELNISQNTVAKALAGLRISRACRLVLETVFG